MGSSVLSIITDQPKREVVVVTNLYTSQYGWECLRPAVKENNLIPTPRCHL